MLWLLLDANSAYDAGYAVGGAIRPYVYTIVVIVIILALIQWVRERKNR